MLKGHGGNISEFEDIKYDFSTNISPYGMHSKLKSYLAENVNVFEHYPDIESRRLKEKISSFLNVLQDNIFILNGSIEGIYLIAELFKNAKTAILVPTFIEYEEAAMRYNHKLIFINSLSDLERDVDLVFLCNPNNPDGKFYEREEIIFYLNKFKETFFIVDEAYVEFLLNDISLVEYVDKFNNLIVLKSFTKVFAIPGLRLGYLVGNKDIVRKICNLQYTWSVNSLALLAGEFIIDNYSELKPHFELIVNESKWLQGEISKIKRVEVYFSELNFFLCKSNVASLILKRFLAENCSILIRDASNFRGLSENYFRVATLMRDNNLILLEGLRKFYE
ncbi:aminotransferase class I/II-fold pyridoxal phosphate-dependent enzyme [Deferribacterales bacterium Es71-Z0220]|uniref:pyridoxal phosphate-dependent aminotransferase n=1 Tax=Deferrivibrio essentukiensis TaxID=2880922 RepID=UPI001F60926D|nr:aminotransferase class I/II-fold pyridoxal phosphate-dependent enzyme [Deferrivibrio essentukiensis]MCB4205297.1 aminotransferase class I/II-fold pyridoxal phosphate-dependent enzyme [Deferrivibrio essentukiensis]